MTVLEVVAGTVLSVLLIGVAGWTIYNAVQFDRPRWRAVPTMTVVTWWMGTVLYWVLLVMLAGAVIGGVAGAVFQAVAR